VDSAAVADAIRQCRRGPPIARLPERVGIPLRGALAKACTDDRIEVRIRTGSAWPSLLRGRAPSAPRAAACPTSLAVRLVVRSPWQGSRAGRDHRGPSVQGDVGIGRNAATRPSLGAPLAADHHGHGSAWVRPIAHGLMVACAPHTIAVCDLAGTVRGSPEQTSPTPALSGARLGRRSRGNSRHPERRPRAEGRRSDCAAVDRRSEPTQAPYSVSSACSPQPAEVAGHYGGT
jgi:hypothetical protein